MAMVLPFRLPAHAVLAQMGHAPPAPVAQMGHLPLDAADREALLACLEIGIAAFAGNLGSVRRMVQAYAPVDLGPQLDALADRVFTLGTRRQPVSILRPDRCAACGSDRTGGNCSPLFEELCADCGEARAGWQVPVGPQSVAKQ